MSDSAPNQNTPIPGEDLSFLYNPVVIGVTVVRLAAAVAILFHPLYGLIASLVFDILDAQVLFHVSHITRHEYHLWDKNVDWMAYVTELTVVSSYGYFLPFFLLLFWRFLGQFMFMRFRQTWMFLIFPNFFEAIFSWFILAYIYKDIFGKFYPGVWILLYFFIITKLIQEIILHILWPKIVLPHYRKFIYNKFHINIPLN